MTTTYAHPLTPPTSPTQTQIDAAFSDVRGRVRDYEESYAQGRWGAEKEADSVCIPGALSSFCVCLCRRAGWKQTPCALPCAPGPLFPFSLCGSRVMAQGWGVYANRRAS